MDIPPVMLLWPFNHKTYIANISRASYRIGSFVTHFAEAPMKPSLEKYPLVYSITFCEEHEAGKQNPCWKLKPFKRAISPLIEKVNLKIMKIIQWSHYFFIQSNCLSVSISVALGIAWKFTMQCCPWIVATFETFDSCLMLTQSVKLPGVLRLPRKIPDGNLAHVSNTNSIKYQYVAKRFFNILTHCTMPNALAFPKRHQINLFVDHKLHH